MRLARIPTPLLHLRRTALLGDHEPEALLLAHNSSYPTPTQMGIITRLETFLPPYPVVDIRCPQLNHRVTVDLHYPLVQLPRTLESRTYEGNVNLP